ncbi:MAG TPA: NUDIX domain-containing protein [Tepidisphaeraceae bacterium]|jgi:8-oxo-dGTP pyrophosphatase MutT (NUDIX family)|nr:NUDIX domain-containing protein [Tepidisphaeraceae bacterium]
MPISEYIRNLRRKIGTTRIMMPAVSAIIINGAEEVLLHRSTNDGKWYVIGGAPDPGEEPALAAVREAFEETGLIVRPERLLGVYADPLVRYPNGDEVLYTATAFRCRPIGGSLKIGDDESLEVRYFRFDALPELMPTHRLRIEHALSNDRRAYFAWDETWLKKL